MIHRIGLLILALALPMQPVAAEVIQSDDDGFVTRDAAVVKASPKQTWLALISPAKWWNSAHTWSGDAANLRLTPQAGGCFCERIPEDPNPDRITLEGSVEHMRVIHAFPERAMRLSGALGPLQSEAVTGVLTIALAEVDQGTSIVWEYAVGGHMRYEASVIAKAVDGVMSQQLGGLADMLGRVDLPPPPDPVEPDAGEAGEEAAPEAGDGKTDRELSLEAAVEALTDE